MPSPLELVFRMVMETDDVPRAMQGAQAAVVRGAEAAAKAAARAAGAQRESATSATAYAQATARLQAVQGEAAKAVQTLTTALGKLDQNSIAAIRVQTQLAQVQNRLATEAGRAQAEVEAAQARAARTAQQQVAAATQQAQLTARLQAASGDYTGALAILQGQLQRLTAGSQEYLRVQNQISQVQRQAAAQAGQAEKAAAREARKLADEQGRAAREALALAQAQARTLASSGQLAQAVRVLEGQLARLTKGSVEYVRVQGQIAGLQNQISRQTADFARQLSDVGGRLSIALTAPLAAFATAATAAAVKFDTIRRSLTAIAGSSEEAQKQLTRLREIAKLPGIDFENAVQGAVRLQAVGFSAAQAERSLRAFANAVALTGGGAAELDRVTIQLAQLSAKGKVLAQDLRPIIEAAPAVGKALKEAFGTVDSEQISQQLEKAGKSSRDFINILLTELEKIPRVVGGPKEALTDFSTTVQIVLSKVGDTILRLLAPALERIGPIIERLANRFAALPEPVQATVVAVAGVAATIPPLILLSGQLSTAVLALRSAWIAAQTAFASSGALASISAALSPAGPIILGVAAALGVAALAWASYESAAEKAAKVTTDALSAQAAQLRSSKELRDAARAAASSVGDVVTQQERLLLIYSQLDAPTRQRLQAIEDEKQANNELVQILTRRADIQDALLRAQFGALAEGARDARQAVEDLGKKIEEVARRGVPPSFASRFQIQDQAKRSQDALNELNEEMKEHESALVAAGEKVAIFIQTQKLSRDEFVKQQKALGVSEEQIRALLSALDAFNEKQAIAGKAAIGAAGAIDQETNAVSKLAVALKSLDLSALGKAVTERVQEIAKQAKSAAEARKLFKEAQASDAEFRQAIAEQQRIKGNVAAIEAIINPAKTAGRAVTKALEQETRSRVRLLEIELRAVERAYQEETEAARRALDARAISSTQMVSRILTAEQNLLAKKLQIFAEERREIESGRLPEHERLIRLAEIHQKELDLISEHNRRVRRLREEQGQQEDQAIRAQFIAAQQQFLAHQERLLEIAEIGRRRRAAADRAAAERGETSFEIAERNAAKAEREAFGERERLINEELKKIDLTVAERERLQDELKRLAEERAAFEEEASRRVQAAIDKDIDRFQKYADARKELADAVRQAQLDSDEALIRLRSQSRNPVVQDLAQFQRLNLERERLEDEHARRLEEIDARRRAAIQAGVQAGLSQKTAELLARQQANAAIEAEEARHNAELQANEEERKQIIPQPGDIFTDAMKAAFDGMANALGSVVEQWVLTGKVSGQAIRQMTAAVLAGIAKQAIVESLWNVAKGIAALANPFTAHQAAGYFAAAKAFAVVAAVAGLAGRAIAGKSGGAGAGGGSGSDGGRGDGRGTAGTPEDRTITLTRGIVDGMIGGFSTVIQPLVAQQQQTLALQQANLRMQAEAIRRQEAAQAQQQTQIDRLIEASGTLGEAALNLTSMPPDEVVMRGAARNPAGLARSVAKGVSQSTEAKRSLVDGLDLNR